MADSGADLNAGYCLYQSPVSYYSGKVRAYLRYKNIPFAEEISSDQVARDIIKPATGGWRVIPILRTPYGEYLQDSSIIMDEVEATHKERGITPNGVKQKFVSAMFELLGDEWLLMPAMHYRWNYKKTNLAHILSAFGQTRKPHWPKSLQWLGGVAPAMIFGNVAGPLLGISKRNVSEMQRWTIDVLDCLEQHFDEHDYLFGGRACYGDFGLFGPLYAHLYLDPYPRKQLIDPRPNLKAWIERMNDTPEQPGDWIGDDEIPKTLMPILQWQTRDQLPFIQQVMKKSEAWVQQNPCAEKLPRFIGRVDFELNGKAGKRMCTPYSQWMLERVQKHFVCADNAEQVTLKRWLCDHDLSRWLEQPTEPVVFHKSRLWRREALGLI